MEFEQRIAQLSPAKLALLEKKLHGDRPNGHLVGTVQPVRDIAAQISSAPLSFAQERLWFLDQMEPDSGIYNLPTVIRLPDKVDPGLVEKALVGVIARHSILRSRFVVRNNGPCQEIDDDARKALDFVVIDARGDRQAPEVLNEEMWRPFELARGPLVRARLIRQSGGANFLLLVMHHITSDGWSINVLLGEFRILYAAAATGAASALGPAPLQYADYAIEQRCTLQGAKLAELLQYWRSRMEGAPSVLKLPLDHPRPARQSFRGALHPFRVPLSALQGLKVLCREANAVPFMVLLAALNVLLFRYAHQNKIVVGTPIANRGRSEYEGVIGLFANTLVLSSTLRSDMTFRELLAQVRETMLGAYDHQELPFEKLVLELQPERSLSHNPLFQVMFILQNLPTQNPQTAPAAESAVEPMPFEAHFSKFDLTLALTETEDGFSGVIEYATDLFERATIERIAGHFVNIISHVLKRPEEEIAAFSFLPESEFRSLVVEWNDSARDWAEFLPLHRAFEHRSREAPTAPAVIFRDAELSYAELDRRASRLMSLLRSKGVGPGSIVGVCLPRSPEMVVALFGILKAGASYMPVDPGFPDARIGYILAKAKANHVVTTSASHAAVSAHNVTAVNLDAVDFDCGSEDLAEPPATVGPDDLAYVMFTSGSTGQPKGVMVSHGAIHNRLQWMQAAYRLGPDDRVMQKTPFTFDVSVWEFFWPLSEGACLVVAEPNRHKESEYLVDLVQAQNVTCMHFVPTMLELFLREDLSRCVSLNRIICSGEALTVDQCERLQALPGVRAHNLYGPTEAAVDVTHWDCDQWRGQYLSVPIGRPIANTQIYVLNERLQPAPIGVPGELYIGGANLALGYLNEPELTRSRFVPNPFAEASRGRERLYRTGDLARFRDDGVIEYLGRMDSQVKLRGVRIELGEIETILRACSGVAEAAVVVREVGEHDRRLAAYFVPERPDEPPDPATLAAELDRTLPDYMIPSSITQLSRLPMTANGKLDHASLPEPAQARTAASGRVASNIEREILAIWRTYLKSDRLDLDDNFFALGGHSILATQVVNAVGAHLHLNVPVRLLFENPSVTRLVQALGALDEHAWLDDPDARTAISRNSLLRLRNRADELTEEELNAFIEAQVETAELERFGDTADLLAWAHVAALEPALEPAPSSFIHCWLELSRLRVDMKRLALGDLAAANAGTDLGERLAAIRTAGAHAFDAYVQSVRAVFMQEADTMPPSALVVRCIELISAAELAAGILPVPTGDFKRSGSDDL